VGDPDIFGRINDLSAEEERLYAAAADGSGLGSEQTERLETIRVELDRCFDLLHQRDARRSAGLDPDDAALRPGDVVEGYEQ
jgi:hypothetical protein